MQEGDGGEGREGSAHHALIDLAGNLLKIAIELLVISGSFSLISSFLYY